MTPLTKEQPRVGVVGLAYPGYNLGDEQCDPKLKEMLGHLEPAPLTLVPSDVPVLDEAGARQAGAALKKQGVDCILAVLTTFVPDYFITAMLDECDVPIFLWAVEREINCLSLVCGPLVTATLFNLDKSYRLFSANIPDDPTRAELMVFARAAMLRRLLRTMRVGYLGGPCPVMFSMATDEYALKTVLGTTLVHLSPDDLYAAAKAMDAAAVNREWAAIRQQVGQVHANEADGLDSTRYLLATRRIVAEHRLDAISLNCFPHLKSKICLAVARLNDAGIAAACEGDLHSTILMALLTALTGKAAFNGDFLKIYPEDRSILFSHCGAGAFSLAACAGDICLNASIETNDGLAVHYPARSGSPVTLLNLMAGHGHLRLAAMHGDSVKSDMQYEGTPMRVAFRDDVRAIVQRVAETGAGHHWNGGEGDFMAEFAALGKMLGIRFNAIAPVNEAPL